MVIAMSAAASWAVMGAACGGAAGGVGALWWWVSGRHAAYERRLDRSIAARHRTFTG